MGQRIPQSILEPFFILNFFFIYIIKFDADPEFSHVVIDAIMLKIDQWCHNVFECTNGTNSFDK